MLWFSLIAAIAVPASVTASPKTPTPVTIGTEIFGEPNVPRTGSGNTEPKWLEAIRAAFVTGRFNDARLLIDAQLKLQHNDREAGTLYFLRSQADAALGDQSGFRTDSAEALKRANYRLPLDIVYFSMGLQVDADLALSSFEHIAIESPELARGYEPAALGRLAQAFMQTNREAQYERLFLALAGVGFGTGLISDDIQKQAAQILLKRGQVEKAIDHARKIAGRDGLVDLLTDRRFAKLWPELERTSGDRLENPAQSALTLARSDFNANPKSLLRRLDLMRAYRDSGNLPEAEKLGAEVGKTLEELMSLNEQTAYAIDAHAEVLAMLGRLEESDRRRLEMVQTWTPDRRWVINLAINRLGELFSTRRYRDILAELDRPGNRYQQDSSPYGRQLLRALRIGSLFGLGRQAEGKALVPDFVAHNDDAPGVTIDTLLVVGEDKEAEKVALSALADPDKRWSVMQTLRIADHAPKLDLPNAEQLHLRFRARPAVAAAFQTYARDLPARFRRTFDAVPSSLPQKPEPAPMPTRGRTRAGG